MRYLRAPLLISALSLLLFMGASVPLVGATSHTAPPSTTATAFILDHKSNFQAYTDRCKKEGLSEDAGYPECKLTVSTTVVACDKQFVNLEGDWECVITSTIDQSRFEHHPSRTDDGAYDLIFDSLGKKIGDTRTDGGGKITDSEGVLEGVAPLDTNGVDNCGLNFFCALLKLPGLLLSAIAYAILVLSTFVLFIAGTVFNWVVIRTVFQFGEYFGTSEGMLIAWGVMRDIANIALLFGFVFVGIATILNTASVEGYSAKKALPRLIIFAVLLNFSLFATQGIIDVANGFASIFSTYAGQAGQNCSAPTNGSGEQTNEECANVGISGKIMAAAGMNKFPTSDGFQGTLDKPYSSAAMLIILSVLVSITAMVLFAASIMLVIRVVVLSILMVTSPIGFAGLAIPSLQKIAMDWWHKLINQAFFAPIYLLMVFVSLKLVDGLQVGGASIPDAISGNTALGGTPAGNMQVLVVYAIVIGFMIGSLMIAQKMGAVGASFATKSAGGLAFGAQGFVARRTIGRVSAAGAHAVNNSKWKEKNPGLARLAYGGLNKGATASFSARNAVGGALGAAGVKLDIGKANKTAGHGYHGIEDKATRERLDFAKELEDRDETAEESAQKTAAARNTTAANNLAGSVQARRDATESRRARQEEILTNLRTQESENETNGVVDAGLGARIADAEKELQIRARLVREADTALATVKIKSAEVQKTETELITDIKHATSSKGRQEAYARSMQNEWHFGASAAKHANHAAASKILKGANKDVHAKIADMLRDAQKDIDGKKEETHTPPPSNKQPTSAPDPHH